MKARLCFILAVALALSGCVTQLPQDASPAVYEGYNRARYGNPQVTVPARR